MALGLQVSGQAGTGQEKLPTQLPSLGHYTRPIFKQVPPGPHLLRAFLVSSHSPALAQPQPFPLSATRASSHCSGVALHCPFAPRASWWLFLGPDVLPFPTPPSPSSCAASSSGAPCSPTSQVWEPDTSRHPPGLTASPQLGRDVYFCHELLFSAYPPTTTPRL